MLRYNVIKNATVEVENATVDATVGAKNATVDATVGVKNATVDLTKTERSIVELIKTTPDITASVLSGELEKDISTIKRAIKSLKNKNIIKRVGTTKSGHWEIIIK